MSCLTTTQARTKRSNEIPGIAAPGIWVAEALTSKCERSTHPKKRTKCKEKRLTILSLNEFNHRRSQIKTINKRYEHLSVGIFWDHRPELMKGLLQLSAVDGPGSVAIKVFKHILPVLITFSDFASCTINGPIYLDVLPKTRKLVLLRLVLSVL